MKHDLTQLTLFAPEPTAISKPTFVTYIPPSADAIDQYAHEVCWELAKRTSTTSPSTDILRGFAAFMHTVVGVTANQLNKQYVKDEGGQHDTQKTR